MEAETQLSLEDRIGEQIAGKMFGPKPEQPKPEPQKQEAAPQEEPEKETSEAAEPEKSEKPEGEAPPDDGYEEVEWGETKYSMPKEIKEALMRQKDYSEKTAQLAETRRAIEAQAKEVALINERRQFEGQMTQYVQNAQMIEAYIKHVESSTDWSRLSTDEIVRTRMELDQLRNRHTEIKQFLDSSYRDFEGKQKAERDKLRKASQEALSKSIPNWSDANRTAVEAYLTGLGYSEHAIPNMSENDYRVAWKAMQYDKLQGEKAKIVQKASSAKEGKPIKATARTPMPSDTQKHLNYLKSVKNAKSESDRQRLVEDRIGEKFMRGLR